MPNEKEINVDQVVSSQNKVPSSASVPIQGVQTAEAMLDQFIKMKPDEFIPWEEVTLPSRGQYYSGKLPGGICRVRAMGIHADKILATERLAQTGESIDYLFRHCVELTDGFDPLDLLSGDRNFLLYYLRGITHGNEYEFVLKCPSCGNTSVQTYDLNELAKTMQTAKPDLGEEPFKVILPYMSKVAGSEVWVKVRFMRGRDISAIASRQRFQKRVRAATATKQLSVVIDNALTENLSLIIAAFGGAGLTGEVTDSAKIRALADSEKMHSSDTATIREFLKANAPGIDTQIRASCPDCSREFDVDLPLQESFFRPTSKGAPRRT